MMKTDPAEAEPLKLKLRVLEAERDRLRADFDYLRERLDEIADEMKSLQTKLDRLRQSRIKRVK